MPKSLIIVESPAKTKTLKNFLGGDYIIEASMGHVRDLPEREIGVDVEGDFTPKYVNIPTRKDVLKKLTSDGKVSLIVPPGKKLKAGTLPDWCGRRAPPTRPLPRG